MRNRILSIALCAALALSLAACGGQANNAEQPAENASSQQDAESSTASEETSESQSTETAPEEEAPAQGNFTYEYDEENMTMTISGTGVLDEAAVVGLDIPSDVWEMYPMIVIEDGITEIGEHAFGSEVGKEKDSWAVISLSIPGSVTKIGVEAFAGCKYMSELVIPEGVTEIEAGAFQRCTNLLDVIIPESVTKIGAGAFSECPYLLSVTIPNPDAEVAADAFDESVVVER